MKMMRQVPLLILCVLGIINGIYLDVEVGKPRCIGQELDQEDAAKFRIGARAIHGHNPKDLSRQLIATAYTPDGAELFAELIHIDEEPQEITQNIDNRGVYEICFDLHNGRAPIRVFLDLDFKSRSGRGRNSASKKVPDIPTLEDHLKLAEDTLADIGREIDFARRAELLLRQAGERTQSRIQWFAALSIIILVITSLWQLIYLRKFFADKKML